MNSTQQLLHERLLSLQPEQLEITDDSAAHAGHAGAKSGGHYTVTIVSAVFCGLNRVQRQRLVYQAAGDLMQHGIHALSMHALTPEEL